MFKENKYSQIYYSIIKRAKSREKIGYTESHHIIPKSLEGPNDPTNLVDLTAREHYICHLLLTKFTEGIAYQKMSYALHRITNRKAHHIKSSRVYEMIRSAHSKMLSETTKGISMLERCGIPYAHDISEYQKERIRESNKSRVWTDEMRKKVSESQKKRFKESPESFKQHDWKPEARQKISESRKKNSAKYTFSHPEHGEFYGTTGDLARAYDFSRPSEAYKLVKGEYKSYKGWKLSAQLMNLSRGT
jgi:hypothetical protein